MNDMEYNNICPEHYGCECNKYKNVNDKHPMECYSQDEEPLDVSTAKCIPVLCDRIYDCVFLEDKQRKFLKDIKFTITSKGDYKQGEKICIEKTFVKYKCIGLIDKEIESRIDSLENEIELRACSGSETCKFNLEVNGEMCDKKVYNIYKGSKMLDIDCCESEGQKVLIGEDCLKFYICKAKVIVKGKIGCEPFRAESTEFTGKLSDGFGFKEVDLFGNICLPCGKNRVDFQVMYDGCFSIDCIRATQTYCEPYKNRNAREFFADAFSTLLITKKIYATVKDELIVYTNPRKLICNNGNIDSICDYE